MLGHGMLAGVEPIRYAPKPVAVGASWAGACAAVVWVVLTTDPASRVFAVAAVALLGTLALLGTIIRPRLAADAHGVRLGTLRGARYWPWETVRRVDVVTGRRLGRPLAMLELDLDDGVRDTLVVLSTLDLGADPRDVADALRALAARR